MGNRERIWLTATLVAGGAAVLAVLGWLALATGFVSDPWFIVLTGAIGAAAGAVTVTLRARRR